MISWFFAHVHSLDELIQAYVFSIKYLMPNYISILNISHQLLNQIWCFSLDVHIQVPNKHLKFYVSKSLLFSLNPHIPESNSSV